MQVTLNIPDGLAARLEARGLTIPSFVEEMLEKEAAENLSQLPNKDAVSAAIDRIVKRREHLSLDSLKIRDLIDEGRRY